MVRSHSQTGQDDRIDHLEWPCISFAKPLRRSRGISLLPCKTNRSSQSYKGVWLYSVVPRIVWYLQVGTASALTTIIILDLDEKALILPPFLQSIHWLYRVPRGIFQQID